MKKLSLPILELSNICRSSRKADIERLELTVPTGESFAVLHSSPEAVSLLLDILEGRVSPKKGKVFFKGDDIIGTKNNFGIVRGRDAPPKKKVIELAAAPIIKRGLSRSPTDVLVRKEAAAFGLADIAEESAAKLPPEKAAEAVIFGAYMCSHELMVIDEPSFRLEDDALRSKLFDRLIELKNEHNVSLLVFTQDVDTAVRLADYVMVVDDKFSSKGIIAIDKRKIELSRKKIIELTE